ncbi:T-cell activation Rho GTPase-activating protein-like isoform X1 [Carassius auratus]|uniref:T-cell activation Rho GTPase-activating protein-like isoform X1 n=1 Tax=Carassius auratus TaxID=7957 RepID=A0A6P6LKZ1_CARAU|nr:T-cell activation Rho GTPase-activating protein-like isoform X1 [Carassius auratus]XP_026085265.1 T-cell activation Rho GTPase-activating protein-like isoform X1 [Carassius auratus]
MTVLSGHGVPIVKSSTQSSMDVISIPAKDVPVNMGFSLSQQTKANLTNTSHNAGNINQRRWKKFFHQVQKKNMEHPQNTLFGRPLSDVCQKDGCPPKAIMDIFTLLLRKGLSTEGVFRKAGNARALKEIKAQLNEGIEVDLKEHSVFLLADLVKDFLRQLPGCLLMVEKYKSWKTAMEKEGQEQKCAELKMMINTLPEPNFQLLKHFMVLLYHISENADKNKMSSSNLATCVSPNLLKTDTMEKMEEVTKLTEFLIDNCPQIFGEDALTLFGDSDEDELSDSQDSISSHRHDSAYDSNDPDDDVDSIKSATEEKSQKHSSAEELWTKKLIRRRSEPVINLKEGVHQHLALSRSQTETDFYDKLLTKQISDDCIVVRAGNSLGKSRTSSKDGSYYSSSSLESCFSSSSENSIHNSPLIGSSCNQRKALQRKHSFPTRQSAPAPNRSETPRKRSQSMKSAHIRSRTVFGRSGSTKRAIERALRHSQTLPDVLKPQPEPRRLCSQEVFQQVDSRIPSNPPSYQQAVQDNSHIALSSRRSLTVQDARCLSKKTCSYSRSSSEETLGLSSGKQHFDIHKRDNKETCCDRMSGFSSKLRQRTTSEPGYEASMPVWCNQKDLRETYV